MYTTLIQANELASHLNDSDWVILDCRHDLLNPTAGSDAFAAGRIGSAVRGDRRIAGPRTLDSLHRRPRHALAVVARG